MNLSNGFILLLDVLLWTKKRPAPYRSSRRGLWEFQFSQLTFHLLLIGFSERKTLGVGAPVATQASGAINRFALTLGAVINEWIIIRR